MEIIWHSLYFCTALNRLPHKMNSSTRDYDCYGRDGPIAEFGTNEMHAFTRNDLVVIVN